MPAFPPAAPATALPRLATVDHDVPEIWVSGAGAPVGLRSRAPLDEGITLAARVEFGPDAGVEYRPRRALVEVAAPLGNAGRGRGEVPTFEPGVPAPPIPRARWTAPLGPPAVEDLASSWHRSGANSGAPVTRELHRLRALDSRWVCLSSIPGGRRGTEIDHLLIGPGGVFTVNAGRHRGSRAWTVGDIRAGRYEVQRVAQLLTAMTRISVRVQGLVVPVGARRDVARQPSNIVRIVSHSELVDYLRRQPPYLDGETRARITGYARLSSTWSG